MEAYRQGRPVYCRTSPDMYTYQNIYGTVRGNPSGKVRPALDLDTTASSGKNKKSFNFLPWKKNKSKGDEYLSVGNGNLSKHNKYKFGSVSALSSGSLYKDLDSSLSYTPSFSASDLKHASVKSAGGKLRGLVTYPWESYNINNNNNNDVEVKNTKNKLLSKTAVDKAPDMPGTTRSMSANGKQPLGTSPCRCQKKKSGPFGTLNLNSLKSSKCVCGFSSVRSSRDFAPPPPPRRRSILPEKVDLYAVHEEQDSNFGGNRRKHENIYDTLSRNGKYKAPTPPSIKVANYSSITPAQSKFVRSLDKCKKDPFSSIASRKSILECDVTAYDLVKSYLKNDSPNDTDLDDDLSDNIIESKLDSAPGTNSATVNSVDKVLKQNSNNSPSPVSSESESGIYSQTSSIRIGGHGMKIFQSNEGTGSQTPSLYSEGSKTNSVDSRTSSWSNSSLSDDGIYSLPEPDYDDDKLHNASDSSLRFNERSYSSAAGSPRLRKYASGGCLDKTDLTTPTRLGRYDFSVTSESPQFSTIRKATSMVSLGSSSGDANGTMKNRVKVSRAPELPTVVAATISQSVPPPPPPPPPPPNFNVRKSIPSSEVPCANTSVEESPKKDSRKKMPGVSFSSSIASELSEKLKSNQPLLKKNEVKQKEPMKVNSHNPYAEVKSILKKTAENPNLSNGSNSPDQHSREIPKLHDVPVQDPKKKKRVQFKSLSNESLAVEQFHHETLSSSDEEWEEARDTFSNDLQNGELKQLSATSGDKKDGYNDGFQTVEEFLSVRKEEPVQDRNYRQTSNRSFEDKESKMTGHKVPAIPRPSQPPPPPPNIRRANAKGPPPPRPLSSTPKSFSHSDLRPANIRNPVKGLTAKATGARIGGYADSKSNSRLLSSTLSSTVLDASRTVPKKEPLQKNGFPSPAASLEATTSPRGKSTGDHNPRDEGLSDVAIVDDSSSESSYVSLPASLSSEMDLPKSDSIYYDDIANVMTSTEEYDRTQEEDKPSLTPAAITCTIISKSPSSKNDDFKIDESSKKNDLYEKNSGHTSSEEDILGSSTLSGPVYSNLLYVPQKSPSPPPVPPLPPKNHHCLTILTINSAPLPTVHAAAASDDLYDTLPLRTTPKDIDSQSIYESRRYTDTGATVVTISSGSNLDPTEHIYSSLNSEAIYEELPDWTKNYVENVSTNPFGRHRGSFFEGASKAEILKFLEGAKERVVDHLEDDILDDEADISSTKNVRNNPIRISNISSSSDSSTISSNSSGSRSGDSSDDLTSLKNPRQFGIAEVQRADSGVGSETSKPMVTRRPRSRQEEEAEEVCADCDQQLDAEDGQCCPLVCKKCDKKRSERKEIVTEIVETEFKYGKDLMIIKEEFRHPMEVAGLLTKEQLSGVFLNLDELILVNGQFAEKLKDAVDIAAEQGDEDYTTVSIGKLFLETATMLRAFEVYCVRQGSASVLLASLEKEKELLRIFLRVSQMENTLLRRMNLSAFLMVPVQRVTKYPLLLNRLYKVTPYHHKDREALREAQLKIELHLEHINQQTKGITGIKIWRRLSNISSAHRRPINNISDIGSIQLRKMAIEVLEWSKEDIRFVMAGKLAFSGAIDFTKSKRGRAFKFNPSHAILATKGKPNGNYRPDLAQENSILFPRDTGIEDATLLLMKEKNGRYSLARDPLHLGTCVISAELEDEDIIEIQEYTTKESIFLKAECKSDTVEWLKQLRYHAKDLGTWKRRRNALANIMINGMIRQQ